MGSANTVKPLGNALQKARNVKGFSLRKTAKDATITPTYLQKLERGEINEPSPNVLYRLSSALGVDYGDLMSLTGYMVPGESSVSVSTSANVLASALKSSDLTSEELEEMALYLGYLRTRRQK